MNVTSVRENPKYLDIAIKYIQNSWPSVSSIVYEDCIKNSIKTSSSLPQWYLLEEDKKIVGCAGLITNDFVSRMDLWPWLCALYIDESYRGKSLGSLLINKAKEDTLRFGFKNLYLCTDHIGYYEKFGFKYIGQGYHPWEEESRIYELNLL